MLIEIIFVLVGVLGWVTFKFTMDKRKYDQQNKSFDYNDYVAKMWDDWVWALIGGYVVFFSFYIIWGSTGHYHAHVENSRINRGRVLWYTGRLLWGTRVAEIIL